MKKIFALIALTFALAACTPTPVTPVDCSTLSGTAAQNQCYGKVSPQP